MVVFQRFIVKYSQLENVEMVEDSHFWYIDLWTKSENPYGRLIFGYYEEILGFWKKGRI